jgi:hypothetical protein
MSLAAGQFEPSFTEAIFPLHTTYHGEIPEPEPHHPNRHTANGRPSQIQP